MKALATLFVIGMCAISPALAQSNQYLNLVVVRVKADMIGDFERIQKEYVDALKKVGGPRRTIWQVVAGNTNEYHILSPLQSFGDLDRSTNPMNEGDWARWLARVRDCVDSRERMILRFHSDLSIPAKTGRIPKMAEVTIHEVSPEQSAEFQRLRREELLPAYRKGGVDGLFVYSSEHGTHRGRWFIARYIDSWSDLDSSPTPLQSGFGSEGYQAFVEKFNSARVRSEWLVVRHRPELSYNPEQ